MAADPIVDVPHDLRGRVLDATEALGDELGEQGVTMRQIAARVGVPPSALYHVFENKEQLLREVERRFRDQLDAALAGIPYTGSDPHARLRQICLAYVEVARRDPWRYRLAFRDVAAGPATTTRQPPHAFLREALACLVDDPDAGGVVVRVWVALHGLVTTMASRATTEWHDDERRFVDRYLRMMLG